MRIVAEVCRGLHAAHELCDKDGSSLGVVHRDVTPGNLILTFDGHMKILDFGIAFTKGRESPDTVIGELKGKPSYMAPEHLRGEKVDRRTDLYSVSVVLHELLTGQKLFSRNTVVATVLAVETAAIPPPSSIAGPLPPGLDEVVMKGLERNADNRFPDARALAAALDRLIALAPTAPHETLEAFVEAELKEERDTHRAWLNGVLIDAEAGGTADSARTLPEPPRAIRTSSAPLTPAGRKLSAAVLDAPLAESTTLVPQGFDVSAPVTAIRRPYQNGLVWLAAIAGGIVAAFFGYRAWFEQSLTDPKDGPTIEIRDKPIAEAKQEAVTATQSAAQTAAQSAAAVVPQAEEKEPSLVEEPHHPSHHPVRHPPPQKRHGAEKHETRAEVQVAKAEEPKPQGSGFITVGAQPYALVRIDGQEVGATPIMNKRLAAGTHDIELVRPDTGEVRLKKTVTLKDGDHERVMIP
jgi:serine/threonine-protein kinase